MFRQPIFELEGTQPFWHLFKESESKRHPATNKPRSLYGLNAIEAHKNVTGKGVTIAIIDSGADPEHPCFGRKKSDQTNYAISEHSLSLESNASNDPLTKVVNGKDILNHHDAHGTALAGIIAGRKSSSGTTGLSKSAASLQRRFTGVAPDAKLLIIRLFTNFQAEQFLAALKHVEQHANVLLLARTFPHVTKTLHAATSKQAQTFEDSAEPDILRSRVGTDPNFKQREASYKEVRDKLEALAKKFPVVCAAGNGSLKELSFPASLDSTIAVGAVNELGWRSTYSQYGVGLDVVAPSNDAQSISRDRERIRIWSMDEDAHKRLGIDFKNRNNHVDVTHSDRMGYFGIVSTDNTGEFGYAGGDFANFTPLAGPGNFGGTSAAAAQVAGVVALMLQANSKLNAQQIRTILRSSATTDHLYAEHGEDVTKGHVEFGQGRVDALAACKMAENFPQ